MVKYPTNLFGIRVSIIMSIISTEISHNILVKLKNFNRSFGWSTVTVEYSHLNSVVNRLQNPGVQPTLRLEIVTAKMLQLYVTRYSI